MLVKCRRRWIGVKAQRLSGRPTVCELTQAVKLPARISDLDTGLTDVD